MASHSFSLSGSLSLSFHLRAITGLKRFTVPKFYFFSRQTAAFFLLILPLSGSVNPAVLRSKERKKRQTKTVCLRTKWRRGERKKRWKESVEALLSLVGRSCVKHTLKCPLNIDSKPQFSIATWMINVAFSTVASSLALFFSTFLPPPNKCDLSIGNFNAKHCSYILLSSLPLYIYPKRFLSFFWRQWQQQ